MIPKFDKSIDDRCNKKLWYKIKKKPDVLILEGWCVGAEPQKLKDYLFELDYHQKILLMMSSGNYGGLDWQTLISKLSHY